MFLDWVGILIISITISIITPMRDPCSIIQCMCICTNTIVRYRICIVWYMYDLYMSSGNWILINISPQNHRTWMIILWSLSIYTLVGEKPHYQNKQCIKKTITRQYNIKPHVKCKCMTHKQTNLVPNAYM